MENRQAPKYLCSICIHKDGTPACNNCIHNKTPSVPEDQVLGLRNLKQAPDGELLATRDARDEYARECERLKKTLKDALAENRLLAKEKDLWESRHRGLVSQLSDLGIRARRSINLYPAEKPFEREDLHAKETP